VIDPDGPLRAGGALLLTANANQVLVDGAMTVLGMTDHEPAPATSAVDRALEVVAVFALLLAGEVAGGQQLLDLLPRFGAQKEFVFARVQDPSIADDAHVIGVAEQALEV
jgi:hypothetical protein